MPQFGNVVGQQVPVNQKLWDMLIQQAKRRFRVYPSIAASHWVHEQYIKHGGQFTKSKKDTQEGRRLRQQAKHEQQAKKHGVKRLKKKDSEEEKAEKEKAEKGK